MWPALWPGAKVRRTEPSPKRSWVGPKLAQAPTLPVEVDRVVEGIVVVGPAVAVEQRVCPVRPGPVPLDLADDEVVAAGNSEIAELWSRCRWVITTTGISPGSRISPAQWRGDVFARLKMGRVPMWALIARSSRSPSVAIDGAGRCRRGSGRRSGGGSGMPGWHRHLRLAGEHGPRHLQGRGSAPPALHHRARRLRRGPATIGSTATVAPGVPPASGSCSGFAARPGPSSPAHITPSSVRL